MGLGSGIRDSGKSYSGSRGQKGPRIPDPDPQHWFPDKMLKKALHKIRKVGTIRYDILSDVIFKRSISIHLNIFFKLISKPFS
jgi:hypothetical protein